MHTPVEKSNTSFKDVMGADEAKQELQDIVEYLKNPAKFSRLGAKLPKGVLLVGPPGCGKTLVARALAGEAGVPFFFASGAEFEEMFVGVGASRVRKLFEKAKQMAPCVIFLDEIDAIGGKRDSPDARYHKMTLNQLLVELDGFEQHTGVIVVAATNLPDVLDPAITRPGRFDRTVMIDLPDVKARKDIIKLYLGGRAAPDVNVESLAKSTTGFSGAELFNMVNIAAIEATKKNLTKIPMYMVESAKDHVMMGPERKAMVITPNTKKLTAFHEAGHALVGLYSPSGENEIVKATLVPRGHALGMVAWQPKEELLSSKEAYLARLDTAMGGRVAEELVYGPDKVTPGAGSDFQQATNIARAMVTQFGMSEKLGKMAFSDIDIKYNRMSESTQRLIEEEVREILEKSYNRAKTTLSKHRHELDLLAGALLEYETLSLEEIKMVIEGKDLKSFMQKKRQDEINLIVKEEELYGLPQDTQAELDLKEMTKGTEEVEEGLC
jgi:ATP-dependent metalloprotease